jgi:hypothetical protein
VVGSAFGRQARAVGDGQAWTWTLALSATAAAVVFWLGYDGGAFAPQGRGAAGIVVWCVIAAGVATRLLPRARPSRSAWIVAAALAAYAAVATSSVAWGASAASAFDELNRLALYVGVFVLVTISVRPAEVRAWTNGIALGIAGIAALALASRLFPSVVGSASYAAFADIPDGARRLSYPVGYWNGLAELVALSVPLLLAAATTSRHALARAAAVFPLPIIACTLYLTSSRTGLVACGVGGLLYFALTPRRWAALGIAAVSGLGSFLAVDVLTSYPVLVNGPFSSNAAIREGRTVAAIVLALSLATALVVLLLGIPAKRIVPSRAAERGVLVAGALGCVLALLAVHPVRLVQHFKRLPISFTHTDYVRTHLLSANGSGRWQLWQTAIQEWLTKPLLGRGVGSYEQWQTRHGAFGIYVHDAHSLYLQTLGELGIVGLITIVAAFGAGLVGAVLGFRRAAADRPAAAAVLAAFVTVVVAAGVDWLWQLPVIMVVGLGLLALSLVVRSARQPEVMAPAAPRPARRRRAARRLATAVVALAVVLIWTQAIEAGSARELRASEAAAAAHRLSEAHVRALSAARLEPWSASPYLQLALVAEQRGQLPVARGWIRAALARDSGSWSLWAVSARLAAEAGAIRQARHDLARARSLNPAVASWGK